MSQPLRHLLLLCGFSFLLLVSSGCPGAEPEPEPKPSTPTSSCKSSSDCTAISCNCRDQQISSFQSCAVVNGQGSCQTCEKACADKGGVVSNNDSCLDSRDGSSSSFRGSKPMGAACDKSSIQHGCQGALCLNDGSGTGFCTDACTSDSDCAGLKCQSFTVSGRTLRYCLDASKSWCNR